MDTRNDIPGFGLEGQTTNNHHRDDHGSWIHNLDSSKGVTAYSCDHQ
jgi:hypothetical protein